MPRIVNAGSMEFGEGLFIRNPVTRVQLETLPGGSLKIGKRVFINEGVIIASCHDIIIEDDVKIGDFSTVHDSDFHSIAPDVPVRVAAVKICRNAWLGRNVVVLPGVTIGENSVVAAGSIVTKSVPPDSLVAGNPARLVRELSIADTATYVRR